MENKDKNWVNIHDDYVMRSVGIWRPYDVSPKDPDVWTKTAKERKLVNKMKYKCDKKDMHFHNIPNKRGVVTSKLIIYLKKNTKFEKTTYSYKCKDSEIRNFLSNFVTHNPKTGKAHVYITKYVFNGKVYSPFEEPCYK